VPRQVQVQQTVTQTRMVSVPKIVEYERPQIVQGKMIRTYDAGQQYAAASQAVVTGYGQTQVVGPISGSAAAQFQSQFQSGSAAAQQQVFMQQNGQYVSMPYFAQQQQQQQAQGSAPAETEGAQV
jgi:hypothetical protein